MKVVNTWKDAQCHFSHQSHLAFSKHCELPPYTHGVAIVKKQNDETKQTNKQNRITSVAKDVE